MRTRSKNQKLLLTFFSVLWLIYSLFITHTQLAAVTTQTTDFFGIFMYALSQAFIRKPWLLLPYIGLGLLLYKKCFKQFIPPNKHHRRKGEQYTFTGTITLLTLLSLVMMPNSFYVKFYLFSGTIWQKFNQQMIQAQDADQSLPTLITFVEFQSNCNFIAYSPNGEFMRNMFITLAKEQSKVPTFYLDSFLPTVPLSSFSRKSTRQLETLPLFVLNQKIYIHLIKKDDWEKLVPKLGSKLTSCALETKKLKPQPKISVLNEDVYQQAESDIITSYIKDLKKRLADLQQAIDSAQNWINSINDYAKQYGFSQKDIADKKNAEILIAEYKKTLAEGTSYLEQASLRELTVKDELGNFITPNQINLLHSARFDSKPQIYVETIIHEQYHYQSSISNKFLPPFFEEGLTQLFTLQTLQSSSLPIEATSYPLPVFIIRQMSASIPIETWEKIYFSKDISLLKEVIDHTYGSGFYDKKIDYLNLLTFDFSPKALAKANSISEAIGGRTLTEEEFYHYKGE